MPKRDDIKSILIIGAGPIVIGQACEFDYSGTQACKALKEEGYRVVLVNSNPATIMTDPDLADATYIEPITPEIVAKIIEKERPDALLPTMGGQTALNTALALAKLGVLDKKVPLFGICLGHQLLALTIGGKTRKMERGHRGANQPVKDLTTGKVEITSQNHGFCVIPESLPNNAEVTHVSLFDGINEGIRCTDKPAFSVQYHPEASPGPTDSHYLFKRFVEMIDKSKGK